MFMHLSIASFHPSSSSLAGSVSAPPRTTLKGVERCSSLAYKKINRWKCVTVCSTRIKCTGYSLLRVLTASAWFRARRRFLPLVALPEASTHIPAPLLMPTYQALQGPRNQLCLQSLQGLPQHPPLGFSSLVGTWDLPWS